MYFSEKIRSVYDPVIENLLQLLTAAVGPLQMPRPGTASSDLLQLLRAAVGPLPTAACAAQCPQPAKADLKCGAGHW
jgi:hypothetical protein